MGTRDHYGVATDLDEMNDQAIPEGYGGEVALAVVSTPDGDRHAMFRPPGFDRMSPAEQQIATRIMLEVSNRWRAARAIDELVQELRADHSVSWADIGWMVGLTAEGARRRWTDPDPE